MSSCVDTVIQAAQSAGYGRLRILFLKLKLAIPANAKDVEQFLTEEAAVRGIAIPKAADGAGAIDWAALLDFIKQVLPLIMQIISLFM